MGKQSGFSLIELAIAMLIISLLIGSILKGQELVNSAKVKNMSRDFTNVSTTIFAYKDKYRALPGDDYGAISHVGGAVATSGGEIPGNGKIEGAWSSNSTTDESVLLWQHLSLSGLLQGPSSTADANYFPKNSNNGRIGVQSIAGFTTITGMAGSFVVCSDSIPGKYAQQIDIMLDDGETSTGALRAVVSGTSGNAVATSAISDSSSYSVCMVF